MTTNGITGLPQSQWLLDSFADDWPGLPAGHGPLAVAHRLARNHEEQWAAEDLCRSPCVSDEVLGKVKRRIDELNGRRVELIDQLDRWVASRLRQDAGAVRHTETWGMIVDRLAIGWVRVRKMSAGRPGNGDVLTAAQRQLAELAAAYDALIADVTVRRRSLPDWRPLKFYRAPAPVAPVLEDADS